MSSKRVRVKQREILRKNEYSMEKTGSLTRSLLESAAAAAGTTAIGAGIGAIAAEPGSRLEGAGMGAGIGGAIGGVLMGVRAIPHLARKVRRATQDELGNKLDDLLSSMSNLEKDMFPNGPPGSASGMAISYFATPKAHHGLPFK